MLSPIPNSLGAGALGLDLIPHATVTSTLASLVINVRIEICVDGRIHPVLNVTARINPALVAAAQIFDRLPLTGETLQFQDQTGQVLTTITLTGTVEDC